MENLYLPIILGTSRPGRESEKAAKLVLEVMTKTPGVQTELIDPTMFDLPMDGNKIRDPKFTEITAKADGFFIVTPEYNHSYPGSLKRLLDSEFDNYRDKPVVIAGVSDGPWGGTRAIEALLSPLKAMNMVVINQDVQFPKTPELFQDEKSLNDLYVPRIQKSIDRLVWYARALKAAREVQQSK
jgi:NAD(P)H-dependent FMN reductase